jgi:hypothetical protein
METNSRMVAWPPDRVKNPVGLYPSCPIQRAEYRIQLPETEIQTTEYRRAGPGSVIGSDAPLGSVASAGRETGADLTGDVCGSSSPLVAAPVGVRWIPVPG